MDEDVIRSLVKWPNVPAVYGWLALDTKGRWLLKGEPVTHMLSLDFINRNYASDVQGQWFFQNGPQRVYVDLAYTPWVYHLAGDFFQTHTGRRCMDLKNVFIDDRARLILDTEQGPGLLDDEGVLALADCLKDINGEPACETILSKVLKPHKKPLLWLEWRGSSHPLGFAETERVPHLFGFVRKPRPN